MQIRTEACTLGMNKCFCVELVDAAAKADVCLDGQPKKVTEITPRSFASDTGIQSSARPKHAWC